MNVMEKKTIEQQIAEALLADRRASTFDSDARYARSKGITPVDYSNIKQGKYQVNAQLISRQKWAMIARSIEFNPTEGLRLTTAPTRVYQYITGQLEVCRRMSIAVMMVDEPGIGKTHVCREYARNHAGQVFYINCSDSPGKTRFVEALARVLGLERERTIEDTFHTCVQYLTTFVQNPLLILDEAGDLEQPAILMVKRLYNTTENHLGIYMAGSDGLRTRLNSGLRLGKNGYTELMSRMGARFSRCSPPKSEGAQRMRDFVREEGRAVCLANGITDERAISEIINQAPDLRKVVREIKKLHYATQTPAIGRQTNTQVYENPKPY